MIDIQKIRAAAEAAMAETCNASFLPSALAKHIITANPETVKEMCDEIERLTSENDQLKQFNAQESRRRKDVEHELEQCKADAERMDHLVKNAKCTSLNIDGYHSWGFTFNSGWQDGCSFREAVDKARKGKS